MQTLLIVVHLMIVIALVGVILLQRSEGGGLGIGGGSGFMTARGAANALTRTTAILAVIFFVTSLSLSLLARYGESPIDILDRLPSDAGGAGEGSGGGILDQIGGSPAPSQPTPPSSEAPAAPQPATPPSGEAQPAAPVAPPTGESQPATPPASEPATPPQGAAPAQPAPAQ